MCVRVCILLEEENFNAVNTGISSRGQVPPEPRERKGLPVRSPEDVEVRGRMESPEP